LNPASRRELKRWLTQDGVTFLRGLGIGPGDTVVDFGCGPGSYGIPAAGIVGDAGLVLAIDLRTRALARLKRRAAAAGIRNIRTAQYLEEVTHLLKDRPCKAVLLYDVLHFMDADVRKQFYRVFCGILAHNGILSVHPKHVKGDEPSRYFTDVTVDDVVREVEGTGFRLIERKETDLWHDHKQVRGVLLTFRRDAETAGVAETNTRAE